MKHTHISRFWKADTETEPTSGAAISAVVEAGTTPVATTVATVPVAPETAPATVAKIDPLSILGLKKEDAKQSLQSFADKHQKNVPTALRAENQTIEIPEDKLEKYVRDPETGKFTKKEDAKAENPKVKTPEETETKPAKAAKAEKPAEAAPEVKPTATKPAENVEEKIKIGDKEYTKAELEAVLSGKAPATTTTPEKQEKTANTFEELLTKPFTSLNDEEKKAVYSYKVGNGLTQDLSPEDGKAMYEFQLAEDQKLIDSHVDALTQEYKRMFSNNGNNSNLLGLDESTLDTIVAGGQDAVDALFKLFAQFSVATSINTARNLQPQFNQAISYMQSGVAPIVAQYEAVQQAKAAQEFLTTYPDLKDYADVAHEVATEYLKQDPQGANALVAEKGTSAFLAEVATRVRAQLAKYGPRQTVQQTAPVQTAPVETKPAKVVPPTPKPVAPVRSGPVAAIGNTERATQAKLAAQVAAIR